MLFRSFQRFQIDFPEIRDRPERLTGLYNMAKFPVGEHRRQDRWNRGRDRLIPDGRRVWNEKLLIQV